MTTPNLSSMAVDAWLLRALHLLHSTNPEDSDKLRRMYRESLDPEGEANLLRMTVSDVVREHGSSSTSTGDSMLRSASSGSAGGKSFRIPPVKTAPVELCSLTDGADQVTTGTHLQVNAEPDKKRPKLALVNLFDSVSGGASTPQYKSQGSVSKSKRPASIDPECSSAVEDMLADVSCSVCKTMTVDNADNNMLECTRCCRLYHQLCHDPPVKTRLSSGWLCSACVGTKTKEPRAKHSL